MVHLFKSKKKVMKKKYLLFYRFAGDEGFGVGGEFDTRKQALHAMKLRKEEEGRNLREYKIAFGLSRRGIEKMLEGSYLSPQYSPEQIKHIRKFKM
jgi:hypothetical protein